MGRRRFLESQPTPRRRSKAGFRESQRARARRVFSPASIRASLPVTKRQSYFQTRPSDPLLFLFRARASRGFVRKLFFLSRPFVASYLLKIAICIRGTWSKKARKGSRLSIYELRTYTSPRWKSSTPFLQFLISIPTNLLTVPRIAISLSAHHENACQIPLSSIHMINSDHVTPPSASPNALGASDAIPLCSLHRRLSFLLSIPTSLFPLL